MSRHVLIDLNKMIVLKAVDGPEALKCCEYWADILIPKVEFYVCGTAKRDLAKFDDEELRRLINSLTDDKRKPSRYSEVVSMLRELMDDLVADDKTVKQLTRKLGHKLKEQSFSPVGKRNHVPTIPKPPKAGTDAFKVWEAANWFFIKDKDFESVWWKTAKACKEAGMPKMLIANQFAAWKNNTEGTKV